MNPIMPLYKPSLSSDGNGKPRWTVTLPDGTHTSQARLMMMNYLHTNNLPNVFHVHHINEITNDDRLDNFLLMRNSDHLKLHHPKLEGTFYSRHKDDPNFKEKMKEVNKINHAKYYEKNKDNPEWRKYIHNKGKEYRDRHKDDPEYKKRQCEKTNQYRNAHKDDPIWREHINKQKRKYYARDMQNPEYREKERLRSLAKYYKSKEKKCNL